MKQTIKIEELRQATEMLLKLVESSHKTTEFRFKDDEILYILVPQKDFKDALLGTEVLGLGSLHDDIERIQRIVKDPRTINKLDLIHLGSIYRLLGELLK